MPDTQPDNLFVKGVKCNVAAKVEGFKDLRPEYIKTAEPSNSKHKYTLNHRKRSLKRLK